jgi:membrane protein implicated in regulation of membrane protease activity
VGNLSQTLFLSLSLLSFGFTCRRIRKRREEEKKKKKKKNKRIKERRKYKENDI